MLKDRELDRTFLGRSLHGQVARSLGMRIVSGDLPEGQLLPTEEAASRDLSVSRTSYREAIKVLTAKGLLESRPKIGTRVRARARWNMLDPDILLWASELSTTEEFANALFEFRLVIEPAASRLAAEKRLEHPIKDIREALHAMETTDPAKRENVQADLAFHAAVLEASGNELLSSLGHVAEALLARSFEISSQRPEVRSAAIPLHRAVLECIEAGKPAEAERAMHDLLTSARSDIGRIMTHLSEQDRVPERRNVIDPKSGDQT
ncbi:FadR/GntR family transcriptional regulator [Arenibacterium sp. CAU 1754]